MAIISAETIIRDKFHYKKLIRTFNGSIVNRYGIGVEGYFIITDDRTITDVSSMNMTDMLELIKSTPLTTSQPSQGFHTSQFFRLDIRSCLRLFNISISEDDLMVHCISYLGTPFFNTSSEIIDIISYKDGLMRSVEYDHTTNFIFPIGVDDMSDDEIIKWYFYNCYPLNLFS